jgi:hypothetical protein
MQNDSITVHYLLTYINVYFKELTVIEIKNKTYSHDFMECD